MINSMLATILSAINALLALAIILGGAGVGFSHAADMELSNGGGLILGLVVGLLVAVMICGLLAVLLDIRAGIKEVAHILKQHEIISRQQV